MIYFILNTLAVLLAAFFIMIAIQLIRMEKSINAMVELTEENVRKQYGKD